MTTKTADLWLSRDPDGSYWVSEEEPQKIRGDRGWWFGILNGPDVSVPEFDVPFIRKGTKRPIRVTVEKLR